MAEVKKRPRAERRPGGIASSCVLCSVNKTSFGVVNIQRLFLPEEDKAVTSSGTSWHVCFRSPRSSVPSLFSLPTFTPPLAITYPQREGSDKLSLTVIGQQLLKLPAPRGLFFYRIQRAAMRTAPEFKQNDRLVLRRLLRHRRLWKEQMKAGHSILLGQPQSASALQPTEFLKSWQN